MSRVITMSQFGRHGRAGNQLFQYAFLSGYAQRYGAELQLPPWIGNDLFGLENPLISSTLPAWTEQGKGVNHSTPPVGDELIGKDFRGYAQYHTSYYAPDKERIRKLFQPVPRVTQRLAPSRQKLLHMRGTNAIGIHLRRGDYGQRIFPIIPTSWYLAWLKDNIHLYSSSVLFIASEDPSLIDDFAEYSVETAETLGVHLDDTVPALEGTLEYDIKTENTRAIDWYPDFYLLSQCDVILGPSSSFSFMAAMLGSCAVEYWRASLKAERFVAVNPWDAYSQLREHVRDYPHLEGISLKKNPYW